MRQTTLLIAMLFAMLCQSTALAWGGLSMNALVDVQHAVMHWENEAHHHHDDGSYHLDDSLESERHLLSDHVTGAAALIVEGICDFPVQGSPAPCGLHETLAPGPTPDGLLRPPRSHS